MPKKYRSKPQTVWAMKTHVGQPLTDIRDFLKGSDVYISSNDPTGVVITFENTLDGDFKVSPGDYILKHEKGVVSFCNPADFEKEYESEVNARELHYVISRYGFFVKDAEELLRDKKVRRILVAPLLEAEKELKRSQKRIPHKTEVDIRVREDSGKMVDEVIQKLTERIGTIKLN